MNDEAEMMLADLVSEGLDFLEIRKRMPRYRLHEMRALYSQYHRAARSGQLRPVPPDFLERKAWVQSQWTQAEWGRRWVGRYAQKQETNLQQAASRLMPE
jgi:hypothetical protein